MKDIKTQDILKCKGHTIGYKNICASPAFRVHIPITFKTNKVISCTCTCYQNSN